MIGVESNSRSHSLQDILTVGIEACWLLLFIASWTIINHYQSLTLCCHPISDQFQDHVEYPTIAGRRLPGLILWHWYSSIIIGCSPANWVWSPGVVGRHFLLLSKPEVLWQNACTTHYSWFNMLGMATTSSAAYQVLWQASSCESNKEYHIPTDRYTSFFSYMLPHPMHDPTWLMEIVQPAPWSRLLAMIDSTV